MTRHQRVLIIFFTSFFGFLLLFAIASSVYPHYFQINFNIPFTVIGQLFLIIASLSVIATKYLYKLNQTRIIFSLGLLLAYLVVIGLIAFNQRLVLISNNQEILYVLYHLNIQAISASKSLIEKFAPVIGFLYLEELAKLTSRVIKLFRVIHKFLISQKGKRMIPRLLYDWETALFLASLLFFIESQQVFPVEFKPTLVYSLFLIYSFISMIRAKPKLSPLLLACFFIWANIAFLQLPLIFWPAAVIVLLAIIAVFYLVKTQPVR